MLTHRIVKAHSIAEMMQYSIKLATRFPNASNSYNGVFLNQFPNPLDPNVPYYSVRVPESNPISGFTTYFYGWNAVPGTADIISPDEYETPVVFRQEDAEVTALYKAHLGTSVSTTEVMLNTNSSNFPMEDY